MVLFQRTGTASLFAPLPPMGLRRAREVAEFIYPAAFVTFVGSTVPAAKRWLFVLAAGCLGLGVVVLGLEAAGLVSLQVSVSVSSGLALVLMFIVLVHLARSASTQPAARQLLLGFVILTVFASPDLLRGMGLLVVNAYVGHWGVVPLMISMVVVLQDRFRRQAALTEQRLREIEQLNEELRFQVEGRSRDLGALLGQGQEELPVRTSSGDRIALTEIVGGRYQVEALLGRGGMGEVYRVRRLPDGAHFALKLLSGDVTRVDAARFAREAELAARLRHPNLVPVVDVGLSPGGPMYLVMELVEGPTLEASREQFGDEGFGLRMLADVARALVAMHGAGIIHRDLKPANVLLSNGVARLADFGIARPDTHDSAADGLEKTLRPDALLLTRAGAVMGTPQYMSPEVALGQPATRASDVFALGLMGFELLTGRYPLAEPAFLAVRAGRPLVRIVPEQALPERVRSVLVGALSEDPGARPSAGEVEAVLG